MANPQPKTCLVLVVGIVAVSFVLCPGLASAHGIFLHVRVEGDAVRGTAEYVGGGAISGATVTVYALSGRRLGGAKTNDAGEFTFTPREAIDHRFWLDAGGGHGAEQVVAVADLPGSLLAAAKDPAASADQRGSAPAADADISRQIGALSAEIARLRHSIRFHDIVGGIGYIMGLTGLWFYLKARRPARE